jgi:shikimate dehydrogenase
VTRRACVIGHPVAHSRSPLIHRHWLKTYRIDGDYLREDVPPEKFQDFIANLAARGYVGANVTVPNKEAAFRALARTEPVAAALGAANTIWLEQGSLAGTNTDVYGFLAHIDEVLRGWDVEAEQAVVLGAGGAARAIVYALLQRDFRRVIVVNRTLERARSVCAEFGARTIAASFAELPEWLQDADILVNTTTLGMTGQPPLEIDLAPMQKGAIVYDIVYAPLETPLLAAARARGLRVVDGLGMLLHQAVPGFEKWFGVRPVVTSELRELVLMDLGQRGRGR